MTLQEILKAGGMYPLRNGKFIWSEEAFKRSFKPGDIIRGGASIVGRITAIGDKRFLYRVTWSDHKLERVGMIGATTGWAKP